jgi:hypothetical protein
MRSRRMARRSLDADATVLVNDVAVIVSPREAAGTSQPSPSPTGIADEAFAACGSGMSVGAREVPRTSSIAAEPATCVHQRDRAGRTARSAPAGICVDGRSTSASCGGADQRREGRAVKRCDNGSAPGISGWTGAHLATITSGCTKEAVQGFHLLIRDMCNGAFTGELHRRLQACCLTP